MRKEKSHNDFILLRRVHRPVRILYPVQNNVKIKTSILDKIELSSQCLILISSFISLCTERRDHPLQLKGSQNEGGEVSRKRDHQKPESEMGGEESITFLVHVNRKELKLSVDVQLARVKT